MNYSAQNVLSSPNWLLHQIDFLNGELTFFWADHDRLRQYSFIDGRLPLSENYVTIPMSKVLDYELPIENGPYFFIFHISFCGSTLLSRLLDRPRCAFVLKEPNCLVNLADWKKKIDIYGGNLDEYDKIFNFTKHSLIKYQNLKEKIIIKPSNWVNNIANSLHEGHRDTKSLFIDMELEEFLIAVFRGGRDRVAFTARAAEHLSTMKSDYAEILNRSINETTDTLQKVANIAAVSHWIQCDIFNSIKQSCKNPENITSLNFQEITNFPLESTIKSNSHFLLPNISDDDRRTIEIKTRQNSKSPDHKFQEKDRRSENNKIENEYKYVIEKSVNWLKNNVVHTY